MPEPLPSEPAEITVWAVEEHGYGVGGGRVSLECPPGRGEGAVVGRIGEGGSVTMRVDHPGRCLLRVSADWGMPVARVVEIPPGARWVVWVVVRSSGDLVLGPCGEPIGWGDGASPEGDVRWGRAGVLPTESLGGVEALASHPALGWARAPTDHLVVQGRRWVAPEVPRFLLDSVEEGEVGVRDPLRGPDGLLALDLGGQGVGGSAGLSESWHPEGATLSLDAGAQLGRGSAPALLLQGGGAGLRAWSIHGLAVADGEQADLAVRAGFFPTFGLALYPELGVELGPGVGPYGGLAAEISPYRARTDIDLSARGWVGDTAHPGAADLRARAELRLEVLGAELELGARSRAPDGLHPDARLGAWLAMAPRPRLGAYALASERWEGIDTIEAPLLRRDELQVGLGVDDSYGHYTRLGGVVVRRGGPQDTDLLLLRLQQHAPSYGREARDLVLTWAPGIEGWNAGEPTLRAGGLLALAPGGLRDDAHVWLTAGLAGDAAWWSAPSGPQAPWELGGAARASASLCGPDGWYTLAVEGGARGPGRPQPTARATLAWAPATCAPFRGGGYLHVEPLDGGGAAPAARRGPPG